MSKINYPISVLIGFLAGIFAIPTILNIGIRNRPLLIALPLAGALLFLFGIWIAGLLARRISVMAQLGKFAAVGFLNTAIDFGILNILSLITGITAGFIVGGINIPGFAVAVINSYFWNKLWVFRDRDPRENIFHDLPKFLLVTITGLLVNSSIVVFATTYSTPLLGTSGSVWLNLAKVGATVVSLIWNFLGYKFLVFRTVDNRTSVSSKSSI